MTDIPSRPRRGTSTQFDTTRQTVIKAVIGSLVAMAALLFIVLGIISWAPTLALTITHPVNSRVTATTPRNMDIWAVYPDDSVRFVSIFYPTVGETAQSISVDVAGPLMRRGDDLIVASVFGGSLLATEILPGPGGDSAYVYERYTLAYESSGAPYGVDIKVVSPPYLGFKADKGFKRVALGADPQDYYTQLIVAVALPPGSQFKGFSFNDPDYQTPIMRPYRRARINGWIVFYYDTTSLTERSTINIDYIAPAPTTTVQDFDFFAVEGGR